MLTVCNAPLYRIAGIPLTCRACGCTVGYMEEYKGRVMLRVGIVYLKKAEITCNCGKSMVFCEPKPERWRELKMARLDTNRQLSI